eukprot:5076662-Prymnesium_polylepis.1
MGERELALLQQLRAVAAREANLQQREHELAQKDLQYLQKDLQQRLREPTTDEEGASQTVLADMLHKDGVAAALRSAPVLEDDLTELQRATEGLDTLQFTLREQLRRHEEAEE